VNIETRTKKKHSKQKTFFLMFLRLSRKLGSKTSSCFSADYATFVIQPSPQGLRFLLEELVASHVFVDLDIVALLGDIQNLISNGSLPAVNSFFKSIRPV
jgi:hypothetical protein